MKGSIQEAGEFGLMTKNTIMVGLIAFLFGLGGGVLGTYSWLRDATPVGDENNDEESEHGGHEHEDEAELGGHSEEHPRGEIELSPELQREFGIEVSEASGGRILRDLTVPGEVVLNADRVAHIVPRVSGQVREVHGHLGDEVRAGDVLAVIDSRELAEAKAGDLAAEAKLSLMRASLERVEKLFQKKIAPEEELLKARQELAEAEIEHRTAEAGLHALGLTEAQVRELHEEEDVDYSRFEIKAPFDGMVIEKHLTLGEVVGPKSNVFVLADLSDVWVNLTVYQKDLASVRVGQAVTVSAGGGLVASGSIDYLSSVIEKATRTARARVVLENFDGRWRPGLFVTGRLEVERIDVGVLVPKTALQTVEERVCVFVETDDGFVLRSVEVGRSDGKNVEITEGLSVGERYVAVGAFSLKAELGKEAFAGEGHHH